MSKRKSDIKLLRIEDYDPITYICKRKGDFIYVREFDTTICFATLSTLVIALCSALFFENILDMRIPYILGVLGLFIFGFSIYSTVVKKPDFIAYKQLNFNKNRKIICMKLEFFEHYFDVKWGE